MDHIAKGYAEGQRIAKLSIWTLVGLGIVELTIGFFSGSVALTADGIDSISDSMISVIVWLGLRFSRRKPDRVFQYGYYKVESLAALLASLAMIVIASVILYNGYETLLHPHAIQYTDAALVTLAIAGCISLFRAFQMRNVAKRYGLLSLRIDSTNAVKDGTASFVVFGSIAVASLGFTWADAVGAIVISVYIYGIAYVAIREASLVLLDSFNSPEVLQKVTSIVRSIPEVNSVFNLRLRRAGPFITGRASIGVNPKMSVEDADRIASRVSKVLEENISSLRDFVVLASPAFNVEEK